MQTHVFEEINEIDNEARLDIVAAPANSGSSMVRVKVPPKVMLAAYEVGLGLATAVAFLAFVVACGVEAFRWKAHARDVRSGRRISAYGTYWSKVRAMYGYFLVYHSVWRFALLTKSRKGYTDIPLDALTGPAKKVGGVIEGGMEYVRTADPLTLLAGATSGMGLGIVGYTLWALLLSVGPVTLTYTHIASTPVAAIAAPATVTTFTPNEIQVQQMDLGPFLSIDEAGTLRRRAGVNNVALIADTGSVRYSQRYTAVTNAAAPWVRSASPRVASLRWGAGAITLKDDRGDQICLNTNQPFAFENYSALIFYVDSGGHLYQAPRDKIELQPLGAVKSLAAANPELSR